MCQAEGKGLCPVMAKNARSWLREDHSWPRATSLRSKELRLGRQLMARSNKSAYLVYKNTR